MGTRGHDNNSNLTKSKMGRRISRERSSTNQTIHTIYAPDDPASVQTGIRQAETRRPYQQSTTPLTYVTTASTVGYGSHKTQRSRADQSGGTPTFVPLLLGQPSRHGKKTARKSIAYESPVQVLVSEVATFVIRLSSCLLFVSEPNHLESC